MSYLESRTKNQLEPNTLARSRFGIERELNLKPHCHLKTSSKASTSHWRGLCERTLTWLIHLRRLPLPPRVFGRWLYPLGLGRPRPEVWPLQVLLVFVVRDLMSVVCLRTCRWKRRENVCVRPLLDTATVSTFHADRWAQDTKTKPR